MKLVAVKPFSYNTRRLQAGDIFETKTERDAKLLLAIKKARSIEDRPETKIPEPKKELLKEVAEKTPPKDDAKEKEEFSDEKEEVVEPEEVESPEENSEEKNDAEELEATPEEETKTTNTRRNRRNRKN